VPRLVAAEPFGPYGLAVRDGYRPDAVVAAGPSVAFSIATPSSTWQGWHALVESEGTAASSDDESTLAAQRELAARDGVFLEASSAITAAVLPGLIAAGTIDRAESVVLLGTSTGLKDIPTVAARLDAVPVIEPTIAALDAALAVRQS